MFSSPRRATLPVWDLAYGPDDLILMGRESVGVPHVVHEAVEARLIIPLGEGKHSLNVAMACAMVTGQALRQTRAS